VDHQRRRLDAAQALLAAAGGEDGAELAADALRIEATLKGAPRALGIERLIFGLLRT